MSTPTKPYMRVILGGLAFGGLVAGHLAAYVFAAPHAHHHEELWLQTGHGPWWLVVAVACAVVASTVVGRADSNSSVRRPLSFTWSRLAATQVLGFVMMESIERLGAGGSITTLAGEGVFLIGLVAQVLVALAGAIVLVLALCTVERLLRARPREAHRYAPRFDPAHHIEPRRRPVATAAWNLRGPPVPTFVF